jgi:hypothetical protein
MKQRRRSRLPAHVALPGGRAWPPLSDGVTCRLGRFRLGFAESTPSAWYSWLLISLVVAGILLVALLVWTTAVTGFNADTSDKYSFATLVAFGVIVTFLATKVAWLLLLHGTLLTTIGGLGFAVLALMVSLLTLICLSIVVD